MQVTSYIVEYREFICPVLELEGVHKLSFPYSMKLKLARQSAIKIIPGEKMQLGYTFPFHLGKRNLSSLSL